MKPDRTGHSPVPTEKRTERCRISPVLAVLGALLLGLSALSVAACGEEGLQAGLPSEVSCNSCHGGPDNAAPPVSVDEETGTDAIGVGAHQAHVRAGTVHGPLDCSECHVMPETVESEGHIDPLPAEVTFGALAQTGALNPAWDRTVGRCANTYCHGGTLQGGIATAPEWTRVDHSQVQCNGCHGAPPPAPHPQKETCHDCHGETVRADGTIDIAAGRHINGQVEVSGMTCSSCHGNAHNAAPPTALSGATDPTDPAVGAHQAHLLDGDIRAALACDACHHVPEDWGDPEHLGPPPAELLFGALASTADAQPAWDHASATCSNVYCHGASLTGGTTPAPVWTETLGATPCAACHGNPPPLPHPQVPACHVCHPTTVQEDGSIDIAGGRHINGTVEAPDTTACNTCHGNAANAAPPRSLSGGTTAEDPAVGAHQAHLLPGKIMGGVACEACHVVPETTDAPGHIDAAPAELQFSGLAVAQDAAPAWKPDARTCSNVYCHGATLSGAQVPEPAWSGTLAESLCTACHGAPPPAPHPQLQTCALCHPGTVKADGSIDIEGALHLNGVVDVPELNCNSCHGNDLNPAPPKALSGATEPSDPAVGAHQAHLQDGPMRAAIACEECHQVPEEMGDPGHIDASPAELSFGPLAQTAESQPAWDHGALTCSAVYCHGASLSGGSHTAPLWTGGEAEAECGTCHGNPPPLPHPQNEGCHICHPGTVAQDGTIDIAGGLHIDGQVQKPNLECNGCHGSDNNPAPPQALSGATADTDPGVGAHQVHVTDGPLAQALACSACHITPTDYADPGHLDAPPAELTFGPLAQTGDLQPAWDHGALTCSAVYCHGATLAGGTDTSPTWTSPEPGACGTCHGAPPPPPHPQVEACDGCHGETVNPAGEIILGGNKHVNGVVDITFGDCDGCHGAPPATGAHLAHFNVGAKLAAYGATTSAKDLADPTGYAFGCGTCHPLTDLHHANSVENAGGGAAEIDLSPQGAPPGSLKARNPGSAVYTPGAELKIDAQGYAYTEGTCANVYCHSRKEVSVPGPVPIPNADFDISGFPFEYPDFEVIWTRQYETPSWGDTLSCDGCHGFPPRTASDTVKAGAGDSHSWIAPDGYEDLHGWAKGGEPLACANCHHATVTEVGVRTRDNEPPAKDWSHYEPIPIAGFGVHVNGQADVIFTPDPVTIFSEFDLSTAQYDAPTKTCSNVSCHKLQTDVAWGRPYRRDLYWECDVCHQY